MQPATRKVVTRTPARTVRIINLQGLLPHPVEAESSLEADYVRRAALIPVTTAIRHQPFLLPVSPKGYTPDFLQTLETATSRIVVEVKLAKKISAYADLFDRAAEFLTLRNYRFYVLTEHNLRKKKIHERALLIRRYAKAQFAPVERMKVLTILADYPAGLPLGTLIDKANVSRELVFHLVAWKTVTTGPRLQVDDSALVVLRQCCEDNNDITFERWFGVAAWGVSE